MILNIKEKNERCVNLKVPAFNFDATNYTQIIDWTTCELTDPPVLQFTSSEDLTLNVNEDVPLKITFEQFPCHTQSVERCVQLVTEASSKCFGEENRDGYIRSKLEARKNMPVLESKRDYKTF